MDLGLVGCSQLSIEMKWGREQAGAEAAAEAGGLPAGRPAGQTGQRIGVAGGGGGGRAVTSTTADVACTANIFASVSSQCFDTATSTTGEF